MWKLIFFVGVGLGIASFLPLAGDWTELDRFSLRIAALCAFPISGIIHQLSVIFRK